MHQITIAICHLDNGHKTQPFIFVLCGRTCFESSASSTIYAMYLSLTVLTKGHPGLSSDVTSEGVLTNTLHRLSFQGAASTFYCNKGACDEKFADNWVLGN